MSPGRLLRSAIRKLTQSTPADEFDLPIDFSAERYLELNPDLTNGNINPFQHYALQGRNEGRRYKVDEASEEQRYQFDLPASFDPETYRSLHPDLANYAGDLTHHYLNHGAPEFRRYSSTELPLIPKTEKYRALPRDFDPEVYLDLNQDIIGQPISPYDHFVEFGIHEKRLYRPPLMIPCIGRESDPEKPTVLLVSHEASRTGAPILSWNIARQLAPTHNLVILLLGKGSLLSNFQQEAVATYLAPGYGHSKNIALYLTRHLVEKHALDFAILNSIETSVLCKPLSITRVPNILLVHEFAANTRPRQKFLDALVWSTVPVFSTQLTKADAARAFPGPVFDNALVLPQGRCAIPSDMSASQLDSFKCDSKSPQAEEFTETSRKLVVGIGSVCLRKGIDIFIEVASQMQAQAGRDVFEFLWVGGGYPDYDPEYSSFLADQIDRSGLTGRINIVAETDNLESLYQKASLLLLTSRLDPLPNIAIDAICTGLPLVCFSKASGIAAVLIENGLEASCVARYIDPSDMARKALSLSGEQASLEVGQALKSIGESSFSLAKYCQHLLDLKITATDHLEKAGHTVNTLINSKYFDAGYYHGTPLQPGANTHAATAYCWDYVMETRAGTVIRKPAVGFNPLVYRERLGLDRLIDPLLHHHSTPGAGQYHAPAVISPASGASSPEPASLKSALHIHAFYVDLLPDILDRLLQNTFQVDLYITVDTPEKMKQVTDLLSTRATETATVSVRSNQGRDVYPFLLVLEEIKGSYDVIGHVHTKRSPHVRDGSDLVSRWRNLLLGNLLGSDQCENMLDRVMVHFSTHTDIDIVFPDDPHIIGWGKNVDIARDFVSDRAFDDLPKSFDFPVGTMFWARTRYLDAILKLDVHNRFSPKEPLPIDGTILHAWERVLGAMAATPVPRYALTHVPGLSR